MTGESVYRALLRLYPRDFREEYGDEMLAAFSDMRRGFDRGPAAFWTFVVTDTINAAGRERLHALRWLATAACGLLTTTVAADFAAWTYRYFYHPYFEGVAIRAVPYGLALGFVLGASTAIAQRLLFASAERRARQWMLASAIVLPVAVFFCSAAIDRAVTGVLPIANTHPGVLDMFVLGLDPSQGWSDLAMQCAAMAASALVVLGLVVTPHVRSRHAH